MNKMNAITQLRQSKTGMLLLTFAILGVIIGFITFMVIASGDDAQHEQSFIGENALAILKADQKAQLVLGYLDMAALFSTREGIFQLADRGGIVTDTDCGTYAGYSVWQAPVGDDRTVRRCVGERFDEPLSALISGIIDIYARGLRVSNQYNHETYQLPLNNYQITLRQDGGTLDVIGNARDDLYFQIRRDRVVAYIPGAVDASIPAGVISSAPGAPQTRGEVSDGPPREEGLMLTINYPYEGGKAYVPKGTRQGERLAVLVMLHGGLGDPSGRISPQRFLGGSYRYEQFIDRKVEAGQMRPILVIAPRDRQTRAVAMWNEDHFTVQELLDQVAVMLPDGIQINRNQLYVAGHSNGGVFRSDMPGVSGVHRSVQHDNLAGMIVLDGSMSMGAASFIKDHATEGMRLFTYQAKNNRGEHRIVYSYVNELADGSANTENCGVGYDQDFFGYCKKVEGKEWYHYLTTRGGPGLCNSHYSVGTPENTLCHEINSDVHSNIVRHFRDDWLTRLFPAEAPRTTTPSTQAGTLPSPGPVSQETTPECSSFGQGMQVYQGDDKIKCGRQNTALCCMQAPLIAQLERTKEFITHLEDYISISAARSTSMQRQSFLDHLAGGAPGCGPASLSNQIASIRSLTMDYVRSQGEDPARLSNARRVEFIERWLQSEGSRYASVINDLRQYANCKHVRGYAIDLKLQSETSWSAHTRMEQRTVREFMCRAGWANLGSEFWHYEYANPRWEASRSQMPQGAQPFSGNQYHENCYFSGPVRWRGTS